MELPSLIILLFVVPAVLGGVLNDGSSAINSLDNEYEYLKRSNGVKRAIKLPEKFYSEVDKEISQVNDSDYAVGYSAMKEYATPILRALLDDIKDDATNEPESGSGRRGLFSSFYGDSGASDPPPSEELTVFNPPAKSRNEMQTVAEILLTFIVKFIVKTIVRMLFGTP